MTPGEMRQVRGQLRKLERHNQLWHADSALPPSQRVESEVLRKQRQVITGAIHDLVAIVMKRELALQRYMVLDLLRDGGYSDKFQVLTFGVRCDRWPTGNRWMWELNGPRLRKDGTIGEIDGGMSISAGRILRRKLDGSWVRLAPGISEN